MYLMYLFIFIMNKEWWPLTDLLWPITGLKTDDTLLFFIEGLYVEMAGWIFSFFTHRER